MCQTRKHHHHASRFFYYLQIHDWGWISFHLQEKNAWDIIILEVTSFRLEKLTFFPRGQVLVFIKD